MANAPTTKEATDSATGTAVIYGAPDIVNIVKLLKGSHSTEAIQVLAIDRLAELFSGFKKPVRVASTADIDLASASDPSPVDGVTLADSDRILLKSQTAGLENGIYDCVDADDPTTWVRSADFSVDADIVSGLIVLVSEGTLGLDTYWTLTTNGALVIDTTALVFAQTNAALGQENSFTSKQTYQSRNIVSVEAGITAFATGGQGSATLLTKAINEVSTVATAADSVKLPVAVAGEEVTVINNGAAAMDVFPNTGDKINALATDAAFSIAVASQHIFKSFDGASWVTFS